MIPALLLLLGSSADAATLDVCSTCTYTTISSALSAAASGDVINVAAGTYSESLTIGKDVTILGAGSASTIVVPTSSTAASITGSAWLVGIAFQGSGTGAGVQVTGVTSTLVRFQDVAITNFRRTDGGGLYVQNASVVGTDMLFDGNVAYTGSGGHVAVFSGSASFTDSTFVNGDADNEGGAIYAESSSLDLTGCTVSYNLCTSGGAGGIDQFNNGSITITDSWFEGNEGKAGAALSCAQSGSANVWIDGSTFTGNVSNDRGGAIYCVTSDTLTITDSTFEGNVSNNQGGAIYLDRPYLLDVSRNLFCGNTARDGGAIYARSMDYGGTSAYSIANNRFVENKATANEGGAAYIEQSYAQTLNNTYVGNTASQGSAMSVRSPRSHLSRNELFAWNTGSAAIYSSCCTSISLDYALFWSNTSDVGGLATKGTGALSSDPLLGAYSADGDCSNDDLRPLTTSPVIDAGDPSVTDPDGTRSDVGSYGGAYADATWYDDADGDGTIWLYDCDDADSSTTVPSWYPDADGDGYGDTDSPLEACVAPTGYVADGSDCDDRSAAVSPADTEVCNGIDDDCDGTSDEPDAADAATWYADTDGDGFGDAAATTKACTRPSGYVADASDCDDSDSTVTDGDLYYLDGDGDGFGNPGSTPTKACTAPTGRVADASDCDDADATVGDGIDWFPDADGDGYGDGSAAAVRACTGPSGTVADDGDCDDGNVAVNPGAAEVCADGVDQDCDGTGLFTDDEDGDGLSTEVELADALDPCGSDTDGDGIWDGDEYDGGLSRDTDGDGLIDALDDDDDGDGVPTLVEGGGDIDGDGTPNHLDDDADGDGKADVDEGTGDDDEDGIPNWADANDADGADGDADGDGISNGDEAGRDTDGDGTPDALDPDDDGDGTPTRDEDANGNGDWTDDDEDGDGIPDWLDDTFDEDTDVDTDVEEIDADGDGIPDAVEGSDDADGDGVPNYLDEDSDGDSALDASEGTGDSDGDGIPDYLDPGNDADPSPAPPALTEYGCGCATSTPTGVLWPALLGLLALRRRKASGAAHACGRGVS